MRDSSKVLRFFFLPFLNYWAQKMEVQFRVKFIRKTHSYCLLEGHNMCYILCWFFISCENRKEHFKEKHAYKQNKTILSRSELFIHRMKSEWFKPASLNKSMSNCSAMLLNSKRGHQKINEQNSLVLVCLCLFTGSEITRITKYYAALRNRFTRFFFKFSIQLV